MLVDTEHRFRDCGDVAYVSQRIAFLMWAAFLKHPYDEMRSWLICNLFAHLSALRWGRFADNFIHHHMHCLRKSEGAKVRCLQRCRARDCRLVCVLRSGRVCDCQLHAVRRWATGAADGAGSS